MSNEPRKTSDFSNYNRLLNLPIFKESQICIFVHTCVYSSHMCYTRFGTFLNHTHIKIIAKKVWNKEKEKKKATAQIGTNVRARVFNAGLSARSQFAFGRSCDRPSRSRFFVVFLGPRGNAELVPKFHVALYASHATLPMVTLKTFALH
jgi:hypothetical protein